MPRRRTLGHFRSNHHTMKALICGYARFPFHLARKGLLANTGPDELTAQTAMGHPLGAARARTTGKAACLLAHTGGRHALATQCIGGGQGIAIVLEKP